MIFQSEMELKAEPAPLRIHGDACESCASPSESEILRFQMVLRAITGKWKIEIVCLLIQGPVRFGALRRCIPGITQHMLTEQLRELAADGIVIRHAYVELPLRVEYELSQAGVELVPIFAQMLQWGNKYQSLLDTTSPGAVAQR